MKLHKIVFSVFAFTFLLVSFMGCGNTDDNAPAVVAEIKGTDGTTDTEITFTELRKYYKDRLFHKRFPKDTLKGFIEALDQKITGRRLEMDFMNTGMHKDSTIVQSIQRFITEEIMSEYYKREYLDPYLSEQNIQKYYDNMSRRVKYRQIVINKPENASEETLDSLRNELRYIKNELEDGASFDEFVNQYSDHEASANRGGRMPALTWKNSVTNNVTRAVFTLNNEVVRVLETSKSFYVIKVDNIEQIDVPPLDEVRDQVISNLKKMYQNKSLRDYAEFKNNIVNIDSFTWHDSALNTLVKWGQQEDFFSEHYQEKFKQELQRGNNFKILTYKGGSVDLQRLQHLLDDVLVPGSPDDLTKDDLKGFIKEALIDDEIVKKANEVGIDNDILTSKDPSAVMRNKMREVYVQEHIFDEIPDASDQALRAFYQKEKDSSLYQLAKVNLYVKNFEDKESAEEVYTAIQNGQTFEEAVNRHYKVHTYITDRQGNIEHLSGNSSLGEIAFEMEEGEIRGPLQYMGDRGSRWAVLKNARKLEERQLAFDEIKDIEKKFTNYHRDTIADSVYTRLSEKYPAVIHEDVLKEKVAALGDK